MAKAVIGIDIGSGHVKMAVYDGRSITQVAIETLPDNLVKDGRITSPETMSEVFRDTVRKNKITTKDCALVLHGNEAFTRRITVPAMTVEELKLNLPFEFRDYIADDKDKYRFDYAILDMTNDDAGQPKEMNLLAAAAPVETLTMYEDMLRRAGLRLRCAAPDASAYSNIISSYRTRMATAGPDALGDQDFCFLNIGSFTTRVLLFPKGEYEVTRVVELGTSSLEDALADHFGVDVGLAKTYLETNYENAQTLQPCLDLYERLAVELSRVVSFFNFNYPDSQLDTVYFGGSGAMITPLIDTLDQHMNIQLRDIGTIMPPSSLSNMPNSPLRLCPAAVGIALQ